MAFNRRFTALLSLTLISSALAAPTNLTWLLDSGWPQDSVKAVVDAFQKANPDIKIVLQAVPFEQVFAQTQARLTAKAQTPDIVTVDAPLVAAYGLQNFLLPLDSAFTKAELAQFLPAPLSTSYAQGKLLAPPMWNSTQILFYNKALLQKAGVALPSADPKGRLTWEQLVTDAQKAMVRQNGRVTSWGLTIEQVDRPYQLLPLAQSLGAASLGKDGLTASGVVNSASWVKAFSFYGDLFNRYGITPKSDTAAAADLFASGQSVFFWGGAWNLSRFSKASALSWGFAPTPYFAGGKAVTPNDSYHLGVNRNSPNAAAATKFIKFITLGAGQDIMSDPRQGETPVLKRAVSQIQKDAAFSTFPESLQRLAAYEAANTAVPRPITPGYTEYQDLLTSAFGEIRTGTPAQQALNDAARQIDRAMNKYRR